MVDDRITVLIQDGFTVFIKLIDRNLVFDGIATVVLGMFYGHIGGIRIGKDLQVIDIGLASC